jgi:hypothetical protein
MPRKTFVVTALELERHNEAAAKHGSGFDSKQELLDYLYNNWKRREFVITSETLTMTIDHDRSYLAGIALSVVYGVDQES